MEKLFNLIFPEKCLFCGHYAKGSFCFRCLARCQKIQYGHCVVCEGLSIDGRTHAQCLKKGVPVKLFSCFEHDGVVRECIAKAKYGAREFAALKRLTLEGMVWAKKTGQKFDGCVAVPIPLSCEKLNYRGFNQSEVIAKVLAEEFGLKVEPNLLLRVKNTETQHRFGKKERRENVRGAFATREVNSIPDKVLLVDDVCTTGSTLLEAAKILYQAGAKETLCFTLARRL